MYNSVKNFAVLVGYLSYSALTLGGTKSAVSSFFYFCSAFKFSVFYQHY